jgi:hypothetical protein
MIVYMNMREVDWTTDMEVANILSARPNPFIYIDSEAHGGRVFTDAIAADTTTYFNYTPVDGGAETVLTLSGPRPGITIKYSALPPNAEQRDPGLPKVFITRTEEHTDEGEQYIEIRHAVSKNPDRTHRALARLARLCAISSK